jgi:hypothetical protein
MPCQVPGKRFKDFDAAHYIAFGAPAKSKPFRFAAKERHGVAGLLLPSRSGIISTGFDRSNAATAK